MSLTQQELTQFHRQGYLLKPGLFGAHDLQPLRDALTEIIDQKARALQADGQLAQLYEQEPFGRRLARIHAENPAAGELVTAQVMGKGGGGYNGQAMLRCIRHLSSIICREPGWAGHHRLIRLSHTSQVAGLGAGRSAMAPGRRLYAGPL